MRGREREHCEKVGEREREGAIKKRESRIRCNFCKSPSGHKSRLAIKVVRFWPSVSHGTLPARPPVRTETQNGD